MWKNETHTHRHAQNTHNTHGTHTRAIHIKQITVKANRMHFQVKVVEKNGATVAVKEKKINQLISEKSDSKTQENNTYFIGRGLVSSIFC